MRGVFDGIGFVLTEDDDLSGGDLDKVLDPETGKLKSWVADIVALGETYSEFSPSGTGVRLFWKGKVGAIVNSLAKVEVYGTGRYLTITGKQIEGCPDLIAEAPLTEAALRARAKPKIVEGVVPPHLASYKSTGAGIPGKEESRWDRLKADCSATIWMRTQRQSGWPFRRSRRGG